jgi:peptidyl-prolyl cis-trans isomerase B (cyclophilin B)
MRILFAIACSALLLTACGADEGGGGEGEASPSEAAISEGPHDVAVFDIRDLGVIRIELLAEVAPKTVANFEKLASEGFYDGTQFHRVIPGFMVQGGDPNTKLEDPRQYGRGGPGYTIEDEHSALPHTRGMVSMANTGAPDSGGSQFFILHGDAGHLDGRHSIFGRVVEGMDVVDAVVALPRDDAGRFGPRNRPYPKGAVVESVVIEVAPAE